MWKSCLQKAQDPEKEEISYFFLHQANRRIIEAAAKRTGVDTFEISDELAGIWKYLCGKHSHSFG